MSYNPNHRPNDYNDYIDREARFANLERLRDEVGRFVPTTQTIRERAEVDRTCACCSNPLMAGEISYRDSATGIIGCSVEHLKDALQDQADTEEIQQFRLAFDRA